MNCKYCGATLPEGSAFCPTCHKSLIEKSTVSTPNPEKRGRLLVCLAVVVLVAAAALLLPKRQSGSLGSAAFGAQKQNKEGYGMVTIDDGGHHYELILNSDGSGLPNKNISFKVYDSRGVGEQPCQLLVTRDGEPMGSEFLDEVKELTVEIVDAVGTPMTVTEPAAMETYPEAALVSTITAEYTSESATMLWRGTMKSGITFSVRQKVEADPTPVIRYFADEYPMHNDEELDALLAQILEETPETSVILLFLPAVTYEQPHTFADRSYQVLGNVEGDAVTTFLAPVTFHSEKQEATDIQNVVLRGGGSGTAVTTDVFTTLFFCTVENWQTGIATTGSGSIHLEDCVFRGNELAVHWNSESLYAFHGQTLRTEFWDNDVVCRIDRLPGKAALTFPDCVFGGNKLEIENNTDIPTDLTGSAIS